MRNSKGYSSSVAGVRQKTLVYGSKTLMVEFVLDKGSDLPLHSHTHEQTGYLVKGNVLLSIGEDKFEAKTGDSWCIPGGAEHCARALDDSIAIEVFSPVREDYIPKAQALSP